MAEDAPRSRAARRAAESALIRVVHHYGQTPEFVLLGGLVPELLCASSDYRHAGTTDVDVQVNLEIAKGAVNTARLEQALRNAEFEPDNERVWRWRLSGIHAGTIGAGMIVKFELLADLDHEPAGADVLFDDCDHLGALNLRGTRFATQDVEHRVLQGRLGGVEHTAEIRVAGLAGFLLAKCAAARARRKEKDWYDIAFVLLHNDRGGVHQAVRAVRQRFPNELQALATTFTDLRANFEHPGAQGPRAYADQMMLDHQDIKRIVLLADATTAVTTFCDNLLNAPT